MSKAPTSVTPETGATENEETTVVKDNISIGKIKTNKQKPQKLHQAKGVFAESN